MNQGKKHGRRYIGQTIRTIDESEVHHSGQFRPAYIPRFTTPEKFIEDKIGILREHFCIKLTDDDITYLQQFKTEGEINNAVKTIINRHWR